MEEVKIIEVENMTGLEPASNFIVKDRSDDRVYIGNGTGTPPEIPTSENTFYANLFMFM